MTEPNRLSLSFEPIGEDNFRRWVSTSPAVETDRRETDLSVAIGPVRFALNDWECPPERLWAWLAAIDAKRLPVTCRFPLMVCDVLAEVELTALPGEKTGEVRLRIRTFWLSAWGSGDPIQTAGILPTRFDWFTRLRARLSEAWSATRRMDFVRPGDWIDWQADLGTLPEDNDARESLFWWRLALAFAPARLPRSLLDDDPAHHRLLRRWAWNALHAALSAWRCEHGRKPWPLDFLDWQEGSESRHETLGDRCADVLDDFLGGDRLWSFHMDNFMSRHPDLRRSSRDSLDKGWRSGREGSLTSLAHFLHALHADLSARAPAIDWPAPPALPAGKVTEQAWVRHPEYGAGQVRRVFRHHEPMLAEVAYPVGPWRIVPVETLTVTDEGDGRWVGAEMVGSPETGLSGPFAFPFNYRIQGAHRRSTHRALGYGMPRAVQAAPVPVKRLRGLMRRVAHALAVHHRDIGDELFEILPAAPEGGVQIDLALPLARNHCWRYGTRLYLSSLRTWFARQYGELQHRALSSGRYFPPPRSLMLMLFPHGGIRVGAAFAHGYLPRDRILLVEWPHRPRE
ncbi:MAG: hypothetical protein JXR29_04000 [Methylothermaceae bacterium]|nr:hypothetical protein [Methylothermaceae bacterium]